MLEVSNVCKICDMTAEDPENENWVMGYIGIIPVTFCVDCYNGIVDMIDLLESEFPEDEIE